MTIHHHPSDDSILAYANGVLGRTLALALAAHLDGCAHCRRAVSMAESMAGGFLDSLLPAAMNQNALDAVLARLDVRIEKPQALPPADKSLPRSLQHQPVGTRRWLAPGIWIRPIRKDRTEGTRLYLLGAAPGKTLPHHGHTGIEMTQILVGEFFDGATRYGAGDFLEAGSDEEHAFKVGANSECVCVIASQGVPRGLPGLLMRLIA